MHSFALSLLAWALWTPPTSAGDADNAQPPGPARIEPITVDGSGQIERYLNAQGLDLLRMRESMEADASSTAASCQSWWQTNAASAPTPQKERVLTLWAQVDPKASAQVMAQVLHRHWQTQSADSYINCESNESYEQRLCQALSGLGQVAAPAFLKIAADPKVPNSGRAIALEQVAALAPADWLSDVAKQGFKDPSSSELRDPLRRALQARGNADPNARRSLIQGLTQSLTHDRIDATLAMRLWDLLGQLSPSLDTQMYQTLAKRLQDPALLVPQRVVYARILAKAPKAKASLNTALSNLYQQIQGPSANAIVLSQALQAIGPKERRSFLDQHPTWQSSDPSLASLSWEYASLPSAPKLRASLLRTGLHSIWPQVQRAALGRLQASCSRKNLRRAATLAGPQSRKGSPDQAVRRAAIDALARCKGRYAQRKLRRYADNEAVGAYDRGRALRRLVEIIPNDERSAKQVVTIIRRAPNELGRSALFLSLGQLSKAPDYVVQELCLWSKSQQPRIQRTSAKKAKSALNRLKRSCPTTP